MEIAKIKYSNATINNLATIRHFVENAVTAVCPDHEAVAELIIALNEAVTNVLVHGYGSQSGPIEIMVSGIDHYLSITVRDKAPTFDPLSQPAPNLALPLEERPYGGMGVHMMRQFVDKLHHQPIAEVGNELILEKKCA